jgi:hypothetical protein
MHDAGIFRLQIQLQSPSADLAIRTRHRFRQPLKSCCYLPSSTSSKYASSLSQVISFTLVAARVAGTFCGFWLIALGIIGKFGAFLANAPNVILGGLQTFVFATVAMAGIRVSHSVRLDQSLYTLLESALLHELVPGKRFGNWKAYCQILTGHWDKVMIRIRRTTMPPNGEVKNRLMLPAVLRPLQHQGLIS